jgi:hypothetical protein
MRPWILALDPGKTTGWATYNEGNFESGQTNFMETCQLIRDMATWEKTDLHIVSESFLITMQTVKNTQAPWSLELIGVARYFAQELTGQDLTLQMPSAAKRFSSDERLKAFGWHKPGKGHANDAARHLLLFMVSHGWKDDRLVI